MQWSHEEEGMVMMILRATYNKCFLFSSPSHISPCCCWTQHSCYVMFSWNNRGSRREEQHKSRKRPRTTCEVVVFRGSPHLLLIISHNSHFAPFHLRKTRCTTCGIRDTIGYLVYVSVWERKEKTEGRKYKRVGKREGIKSYTHSNTANIKSPIGFLSLLS